jgi:hypothetical protein
MTTRTLALLLLTLAACSGKKAQDSAGAAGSGGASGGAGTAGSTGGAGSDGGAMTDGPALPEVPFAGPDAPTATYVPKPSTCGFDAPAFCETFEAGPATGGGRSGELDPARWSVVRGEPQNSAYADDVLRVGPALIGQCRGGLSNTRVLPDADVFVCDPIATIPTRHALAAAAEQNYGLATYRVRQPFDFAGRTGTIKLDMDLSNNGLGGWPALVISEDPAAAPSFDWQERGSGPRNGVDIEFGTGWCNTAHTLETIVYTFNDYLQTSHIPSFDCSIPHAMTAPDSLNHVEIYLTQTHLEVWTSDASPDGASFPNLHKLWEGSLALPFSRGYVTLAVRNHATLKYWLGSAATVRFDNFGFDGPTITGWREYSAPDSLTPYQGLPGCKMGGTTCQWEGDVIPANPTDADRVMCANTTCTYDGQGRNVGYNIPTVDDAGAQPVAFPFKGVTLAGAKRARLVLAADYPWFEWANMFPPPTHMNLRHRENGGAWHDRFVTDVEANAFMDFNPSLGGAGASAGLLNQVIDLDFAELKDGDNTVELLGAGTWTGSYHITVTGVDLVLD